MFNNNELEIEKSKSKDSSKRVNLRKDIVNKTIIRAFKKFYNKLFKWKFKYKGKSRDFLYNKCAYFVKKVLKSTEHFQVLLSKVNDRNHNGKSVDLIVWIYAFQNFFVKPIVKFVPLPNLII